MAKNYFQFDSDNPTKKRENYLTPKQLQDFLRLLSEEKVKKCFDLDACFLYTDRFAIAATLCYFTKTGADLTPTNFYGFLHLANAFYDDWDLQDALI
jgi:hypothetical protein